MKHRFFLFCAILFLCEVAVFSQSQGPAGEFGRALFRADVLEGDFIRDMRPDEARFMGIIMRILMNEDQGKKFARFEQEYPMLVQATRKAFDAQDNRMAYLLSCRVALLFSGIDFDEGIDLAIAYHLQLSARLVDPKQGLNLRLEPLFRRTEPLIKGPYLARFSLINIAGKHPEKILAEIPIQEMKDYALKLNTKDWTEGEYAIKYELMGPDSLVLINGLQRRFQVVSGLDQEISRLSRQWQMLQGKKPVSIPEPRWQVMRATATYILDYVTQAMQSYAGGTHQTGYPMVQRIRQQDEGRRQPFPFRNELSQLRFMLDAVKARKDPFPQLQGELCLAYFPSFNAGPEPFRVALPKTFDFSQMHPLIVALHGAGGDETSFMRHYTNPDTGENFLKDAVCNRGYILATPRGGGSYSYYEGNAGQDVLEVTRIVQQIFPVSPEATFLMGHSMGGGGTIKIGLRHPELYAALAPVAGGANDVNANTPLPGKAAQMPVIFAQGALDNVVPAQNSRRGAKILSQRIPGFQYKEYAQAGHNDVVYFALPDILDFFDQIRQKR